MEFHEEIDSLLEEIREENKILKDATEPQDQIESLKEILDGFMMGMQKVREHIDRFNERRWQR